MSKTTADLRDAIIARMDKTYDLIFVSYDDRLTDEQASALVSGDMESLWDSIGEWESDARYQGAIYEIEELTKDVLNEWRDDAEEADDADALDALDELEHDWEWSTERDETRWEIEDRESGDWLRQLVDQTPSLYVRVAIGSEFYLTGNADEDSVDDVMGNLNLEDTPALREVVRTILPEAGEGACVPYLFASVHVGDIYRLDATPDDLVTITGGSLLLENPWMGSGYNDNLPEGMTVTVPRSALVSDDEQFGYSWDSVCGLVRGAWPATVAKVEATEVAA